MTGERPKLVLMRYAGPADERTAGTVRVAADCGHQAWISPGGIETQARTGAETVCDRCIKLSADDEIAVTPEVYRDLIAEIGKQEADRIIALTRDPRARAALFGRA